MHIKMNHFCALISALLLPSVALAELTGSLSGEAAAAGSDTKLVAEPIIHQVCEGRNFCILDQDLDGIFILTSMEFLIIKSNMSKPVKTYTTSIYPPTELSVPVQVSRRVDGDGGRGGVEEGTIHIRRPQIFGVFQTPPSFS